MSDEAARLVTATQAFAAAVKAGDVATAKSLYAAARSHYEAIEPIAESFGNLDPAIDARENDVEGDQWTGFHRLEKALWVDNSAAGMPPWPTSSSPTSPSCATSCPLWRSSPPRSRTGRWSC